MPLGREVGLGPGHIVLDMRTQLPLPQKGTASPNFRCKSIVAKRSPISATAEHAFMIQKGASQLSVLRACRLLSTRDVHCADLKDGFEFFEV